jgi:hypothetical protein
MVIFVVVSNYILESDRNSRHAFRTSKPRRQQIFEFEEFLSFIGATGRGGAVLSSALW